MKTPGESLDMARDFRKALLEALERLENEDSPYPLLQGASIRTKKEEQDTMVAGRKIRDKELRERTSSGGNSNDRSVNKQVASNSVLSANQQTPVPVIQTQPLVSPKPTSATPTPVQQSAAAAAHTQPQTEDEDETKAKVEDVQFIHAPLVAAFTVQQDDKGLPHKVIPIYGNKRQQQQTRVNSVRQYQTNLEEKQRALEQQIRVLQEQRRQQELLLLQQQQQLTLQTTPRNTATSATKANVLSDTVVSLQPSVSFQPSLLFNRQPLIGRQELPMKPAVVFRSGAVLQSLPRQYRDNVFNPDNYLQEFFYQQRTLVPPPPRSNRVFRQETTHVGNFGQNQEYEQQHRHHQRYQFNDNYNSIVTSPAITTFTPTPNQSLQQHNIVSSNSNTWQPMLNVNDRLKNLIFQSGLGQGRTQEDLNIVSKVLALDHSAAHYPNFLFSESNVSENRLPFAMFYKTY